MARFFGCNLDKKAHLDRTVLNWLQKLPDDFFVFVEIEGGDFSIDFLVLKPNGIFNIEAKHWNVLDARADADWVLKTGERRENPFHEQVLDQCEKFKQYLRIQRNEVFGTDRASAFERFQSDIRIFPVVALSHPDIEPTIEHHVWRRIFAKDLILRQHLNRFEWFPGSVAKPFSLTINDIRNLASLFHVDEVSATTLTPQIPSAFDVVRIGAVAAKPAPVTTDTNPYQTVNVVTGTDFYGRATELKRVKRTLEQGLPAAILGLQRTGKSSLAMESISRMCGGNPLYTVIKFDFRSLNYAPDREEDLAVIFLRAMAAEIPDIKVNKSIEQYRDRAIKGSLTEQRELFRLALIKNREQGRRTVLFLDECEEIVAGLGAHKGQSFIAYLDALCRDRDLGLNIILAGRPGFFFIDPIKDINLGRLFQPITLGALEPEAASELIHSGEPVLTFNTAAEERLKFITGNHPFWLQLLCRKLFEEAADCGELVCDADMVNVIFEEVMRDPGYKASFVLLYQDIEKDNASFELLKRIAELAAREGDKIALSDVAPDWKTNKEIRRALSLLREYQIVTQDGDPAQPAIRFEFEALRQWMRAHLMTL